jgi:mitochondrial distribution and morphology protein 31
LTSETGVQIIFESAIVPKWKDSRISFKNVYVCQGPIAAQTLDRNAGHNAAVAYDISNHPVIHGVGDDEDESTHAEGSSFTPQEDSNYAAFDLTIDSVDVTLSLWRWLDGKGLVKDATVKGVRGVLGL